MSSRRYQFLSDALVSLIMEELKFGNVETFGMVLRTYARLFQMQSEVRS